MKNDSCPGPDGLSYALYKCFSTELIPLLKDAFTTALEKGSFNKELSEGYITLIYKKGEPNQIANYRPITLLNCNYKLFTKTIMIKVNSFTLKLLGNSQFTFINGCRAIDNVMNTALILDLLNTTQSDRACTFLDFEKAYDRVNHTWLWKILKRMNFGDKFCDNI